MVRGVLFAVLLLAGQSLAQWPELNKPLPKQYAGEKDAALIISVSDYAFLPDVPGANENAAAWFQHLTVTRGIPATQVQWLQDNEATVFGIRKAVKQLALDVKPGGVVWLLYIGHGAPSQDGSDGVLVGVSAQNIVEELYANSVPQKEVLKALDAGKQSRSVVLIDACFSGDASGTGKQLATSTMPTLPERVAPPESKRPVLLLTAGTSRQFAGALPGANVPAFSYLALGAMRGWADEDANGQVTAGEAVRYINAVMRTTVKGRTQTPQLNPQDAADMVIGRADKNEPTPALNEIVLQLKTGGRRAEVPAPTPEVKPEGLSKAGRAATGALSITTTPPGARLDLVDPNGTALVAKSPFTISEAAVGRWKVKGSVDGYAPEQAEFEVLRDVTCFAELTLNQYASLSVTGTPVGASVKVTGPRFSDEGGLPWRSSALPVGDYTVTISHQGYVAQDWRGTLEAGRTREVTVDLKRLPVPQDGPVSTCPPGSSFVKGGVFGGSQVAGFCATPASLDGAAAALRFETDRAWKRYASLHLRWSRLSNTSELKATTKAKTEGLSALERELKVAARSSNPAVSICAHLEIGAAYEQLASEVTHPPEPPGLPPELRDAVKVEFAKEAAPLELTARQSFLSSVEASHQANIYNSCTVAAMSRLVAMERALEPETSAGLDTSTPGTADRCPAGMVVVPGGQFTMADRGDKVVVAEVCIDVTEVTVAAYAKRAVARVTWNDGSIEKPESRHCNGNKPEKQNHPVNCVDWNEAQAYCKAMGGRLPTEEEWEWAARGGKRGLTYPWGHTTPTNQVCWDGEGNDEGKGRRSGTCVVGRYPSGDAPAGIKDLAGNVWEWTSSSADVGMRVYRGSCWNEIDPLGLRAGSRGGQPPALRRPMLGFRCVRDLISGDADGAGQLRPNKRP